MYWLNPTFAPIVVFATCVLLFGLLALSLANRKAARTASPSPSASARQIAARPAQNNKPAYVPQRTASSIHSSGLSLSITTNYAPREEAQVVAESVAQLMAPLKPPASRTQKEVVLDLPVPTQANVTSAGPFESEAPLTPKSETEESASSSPPKEEPAAVEKQPAEEIESTAVPQVTDDSALALQPAAAEEPEKESAARLVAPPSFPAPTAQNETPVDVLPVPFPDLNSFAPSENLASVTPESEAEETALSSPAPNELASVIGQYPAQEVASANGLDATDDPTSRLRQADAEEREAESAVSAPVPETVPVAVLEKPKKQEPTRDLLEFYGLKQQPFDVTPDPAYLYFTPSHREALVSLTQGVDHLRGFMMLVAEPGMGKTTLMNKLMEKIGKSARVVFLFQTQCSSSELLAFILDELEVDHAGMGVVAMHRVLNQALLEEMMRGQRFVLIVDEAQNLQEPVLETIRLLSDFETTHSKLIQIILVGQPPLADTLMRPGLKQLRQRISVLTSLKELGAGETAEYVEHRLRTAGGNGKPLFTPEALTQIAESSKGVPRSINNLCFNSMLASFVSGKEIIDADIVERAGEKLNLEALASLQEGAIPEQAATRTGRNGTEEFARPPAVALTAEAPNGSANGQPKPKTGVTVYIGDEAATQATKPIRIRIEHD